VRFSSDQMPQTTLATMFTAHGRASLYGGGRDRNAMPGSFPIQPNTRQRNPALLIIAPVFTP